MVSRSMRVTTMSPRYRSHRRSVLALAPTRMVECRSRKRYRKLIAMSQLVVASNNPALSCPLRAHVAHDLRNLLATVGLHLETLQRLSGPSGAKAANAANALPQPEHRPTHESRDRGYRLQRTHLGHCLAGDAHGAAGHRITPPMPPRAGLWLEN